MSAITIRDVDERLAAQLRERANAHGVSVSEEARQILESALAEPSQPAVRMGSALTALFGEAGGVDLNLPKRDTLREQARFD